MTGVLQEREMVVAERASNSVSETISSAGSAGQQYFGRIGHSGKLLPALNVDLDSKDRL